MKKKVCRIVAVIVLLVGIYFVGSGFIKKTDVYMAEYSVSEDNTQIDMNVFVSSSMGYVGRYIVKQNGTGLYVTFYSTFGGLNSSLGAGNTLTLELPAQCEAVYFNRGGGNYQRMLQKNHLTKEWERVLN